MSEPNFYQILGVGRAASADQIKSAYRELVKRHHPDLFPAAREKTKATEKLRQINEAYAVLGNVEQRQRYDQRFIQKPKTRAPAQAAAAQRRASRPRRHPDTPRKAAKIRKPRLHFTKKRAAYTLAAAMVVLVLIYAGRREPRVITAWTLLEKLEVSPEGSNPPPGGAGPGWIRLAQYASAAECSGVIKQKVRKDEQEGSRAVYDEQNGTMAITVYVKKETAEAREGANLTADREQAAAAEAASKNERGRLEQRATEESTDSSPKSGITKRVRSLECRASQRLENESGLQRMLKRIGLLLWGTMRIDDGFKRK